MRANFNCYQAFIYPVQYISTRGDAPHLNFSEVTLAGLAVDGGLYVPQSWPQLDNKQIRNLRGLSYPQLATELLGYFATDLSRSTISTLTQSAYQNFSHQAIAPLKQLDTSLYFMELFNGPTLAFKDFALQFLGQLFSHLLSGQNKSCTIIGATSGDTGSAAIEAVRGLDAVTLFMLHPEGKVSEVQRRQMTTVLDENIHNLAVSGTFDDCQSLVKAMFNDPAFRNKHNLSAVNSINWARIAAQVVYYFRAALELGAPDVEVNFSVPTGNFGNVFAGYIAKRMGLPIRHLIIGSNSNDILTRFFETGKMQQRGVNPTLSPSMDIQVSSNFERFLFELFDRDGQHISKLMNTFAKEGEFSIDSNALSKAQQIFRAHRLDDGETQKEMARLYRETGEIIDPHSIIGVTAARKHHSSSIPTIALGTAHPAKFANAVSAAIGVKVELPPRAQGIMQAEERMQKVDNNLDQIQTLIDSN